MGFKKDPGKKKVTFKGCSLSHILSTSQITIDCSSESEPLENLAEEKKNSIIYICRIKPSQIKDLTICNAHLERLTCPKGLNPRKRCLSPIHSINWNINVLDKNRKATEIMSDFLWDNYGVLLPVGGLICNSCRLEICNRMNPMSAKGADAVMSDPPSTSTTPPPDPPPYSLAAERPRRVKKPNIGLDQQAELSCLDEDMHDITMHDPSSSQATERPKSVKKPRIDLSQPEDFLFEEDVEMVETYQATAPPPPYTLSQELSEPQDWTQHHVDDGGDQIMADELDAKDTSYSQSSTGSVDSNTESIFHLERKRRGAMNYLMEICGEQKRIRFTMDKEFGSYAVDTQTRMNQVLTAAFSSVLKTVSKQESDHGKIWSQFLNKKAMFNRFHINRGQRPGFVPSLIVSVIKAWRDTQLYRDRLQLITPLVEQYSFRILDSFNPKPTKPGDVDEDLTFVPPLTEYFYGQANKHILRNKRILAPKLAETRYVHKVKEEVLELIFDFCSSPAIIQTMAFGTYKWSRNEFGAPMECAKVVRLYNNMDLVTMVTNYLKEIGLEKQSIPHSRTLYRFIKECMPAQSRKMMRGINPYHEAGIKAFDDLAAIICGLENHGLEKEHVAGLIKATKIQHNYHHYHYKVRAKK